MRVLHVIFKHPFLWSDGEEELGLGFKFWLGSELAFRVSVQGCLKVRAKGKRIGFGFSVRVKG